MEGHIQLWERELGRQMGSHGRGSEPQAWPQDSRLWRQNGHSVILGPLSDLPLDAIASGTIVHPSIFAHEASLNPFPPSCCTCLTTHILTDLHKTLAFGVGAVLLPFSP